MKMGEYICREAIINEIEEELTFVSRHVDIDALISKGLKIALKHIKNQPTADVQPVDKWISADERLPENFADCLVWYKCDTAFGKSESWGIAACSRGEWYTKHLHGDNIVVMYWRSMPKPPKDGEQNENN